jgi:hypothetical protein
MINSRIARRSRPEGRERQRGKRQEEGWGEKGGERGEEGREGGGEKERVGEERSEKLIFFSESLPSVVSWDASTVPLKIVLVGLCNL